MFLHHFAFMLRNKQEMRVKRSENVFGLLSLFSVLVCFKWFLFF